MKPFVILWQVVTDRLVWAGAGSSSTSLLGATMLDHTREALAIFAALFGGLSALATFIYMCIKISRLLKHPEQSE